jgi:hypothetical protein
VDGSWQGEGQQGGWGSARWMEAGGWMGGLARWMEASEGGGDTVTARWITVDDRGRCSKEVSGVKGGG